jgi:hypothetical protein
MLVEIIDTPQNMEVNTKKDAILQLYIIHLAVGQQQDVILEQTDHSAYRKPVNLALNRTTALYTCIGFPDCISNLRLPGKLRQPRANSIDSIMLTSKVSASRCHPTMYRGIRVNLCAVSTMGDA